MNRIIANENIEVVNKEAFEMFILSLDTLASQKEEVFIVLSGGNSLIKFYKLIIVHAETIPKETWKKVKFCFADERIVPLDSKDSNYKLVLDTFLKQLIEESYIEYKQILKIYPDSQDVTQDYNSKIKQVDIVLLGVGPDGHTCSLFPNHSSIQNESENYILVEDSPKPPQRRISMSRKMLGRVHTSFIFFIGDSKKEAYKMFNDQNKTVEECPCKLATRAQNCYVVTNISKQI